MVRKINEILEEAEKANNSEAIIKLNNEIAKNIKYYSIMELWHAHDNLLMILVKLTQK